MAEGDVVGVPSGNPANELSGSLTSRPEWELLVAGGYTWVRQLGRGQYGTAHLVQRDTEEAVAKVVFLDHLKDRDRALALQEVEVLRRLMHQNTVRHYASWLHHQKGPGYAGQEALVTVMEFCAGGDLREYLESCARSNTHLPEAGVLSLFAQMVAGIRYVHQHKVLHRDLKTSNMLLDAEHRIVKIGDFGIARVLENTAAVALTMLGTPYYMSPEVCKGEPYHHKSDMWSLGCVLYEMCVLRHAFESQSLLGLVYCIVSEHYDPIPPERYGPALSDLLAQLLAKSHSERPSAEQTLRMEVLQPYCGSDGEAIPAPAEIVAAIAAPTAGAANVPPPPPPQASYDFGDAPRPPPSPGGRVPDAHSSGFGDVAHEQAPPLLEESMAPLGRVPQHMGHEEPPPPPMEPPPPGCGLVSTLPTLPQIRRPAPPPPPEESPGRSTRRASGSPTKGPLSGTSAQRCMSPPRGLVAAVAAASCAGRGQAQAPAMPWAEATYETQVCIARARSALLRRPRSLGNWVQAFAHYDTTGYGVLGAVEFSAFLESLSLGLSHVEIHLITHCLTRETGSVSLGGFSEAITHGAPSDLDHDEAWAVQAAGTLAAGSSVGLRALAGRTAADVLSELSSPADDAARLLMWLPKSLAGEADWGAAEEWRISILADQSL